MSILQAFLLGLLQGIAEFLPISSSGHLSLAESLLGLDDIPLLFDILLHLATLLAVVVFFWKKIWQLLCAFGRLIIRRPISNDMLAEEKNRRSFILAIFLATLVTGVLGLIVEKLLGEMPVKFVCLGFIITSFLLIASSISVRHSALPEEGKSPSAWQALFIGFAQGIGTLPGISRSGSTIASALFCGLDRTVAGEFSFLVSIPAILGAFLLELKDLSSLTEIGLSPLAVGFLTAFVCGYLALMFLMKLIKKGRLGWFALYLIPLGLAGLILL